MYICAFLVCFNRAIVFAIPRSSLAHFSLMLVLARLALPLSLLPAMPSTRCSSCDTMPYPMHQRSHLIHTFHISSLLYVHLQTQVYIHDTVIQFTIALAPFTRW